MCSLIHFLRRFSKKKKKNEKPRITVREMRVIYIGHVSVIERIEENFLLV